MLNVPQTGPLPAQTGPLANFPVTGDGSIFTAVLRYTGGNPGTDPGVGIAVYQAANLTGNQPETAGLKGATAFSFQAINGLPYVVQPYDYVPNLFGTFHFLLSNMAAPAPAINPEPSGYRGGLARDQAARQAFVGQAAGTLHNYTFAGDGQVVTFVLDAKPRDTIGDNGIGFLVVDEWGNVQQSLTLRNAVTPGGALVWTFTTLPNVSYTVQISNYQVGLPVTYVLSAL